MPTTNDTCDCKDMSCEKSCIDNHTHKHFWCEKCYPEMVYKLPSKESEKKIESNDSERWEEAFMIILNACIKLGILEPVLQQVKNIESQAERRVVERIKREIEKEIEEIHIDLLEARESRKSYAITVTGQAESTLKWVIKNLPSLNISNELSPKNNLDTFYVCPNHRSTGGYESCYSCGRWSENPSKREQELILLALTFQIDNDYMTSKHMSELILLRQMLEDIFGMVA